MGWEWSRMLIEHHTSVLFTLQKLILTQLGVYPGSQGTKEEWPLQVYPRTLAIIAQVT